MQSSDTFGALLIALSQLAFENRNQRPVTVSRPSIKLRRQLSNATVGDSFGSADTVRPSSMMQ